MFCAPSRIATFLPSVLSRLADALFHPVDYTWSTVVVPYMQYLNDTYIAANSFGYAGTFIWCAWSASGLLCLVQDGN